MVDAAGAIYVIGGTANPNGGRGATYYKDVWASTDGGARAGLGQRGVVGGLHWVGTTGVLRGC